MQAEDKEIKPGDEVIVRAIVKEVMDIGGGEKLLHVEWQTSAPIVDYVKASQVEKADDGATDQSSVS